MTDIKNLLFIPCYNCKTQINRVVESLTPMIQSNFHTILFIDNGSIDGTLSHAVSSAENIRKISKFVFLKNDANYGLGGSHKVAFIYAQEHSFDFIGVLHGDDQANINDLSNEIDNLSKTDLDCILGSRFLPESHLENYSKIRIFGNLFFNFIFSVLLKKKISDLGSGLNFYRVSRLKKMKFIFTPDDLTFNYVFLCAIVFGGLKIKFVPISWREKDQISNVRALSQIKNLMIIIFRLLLHRENILKHDHRLNVNHSYQSHEITILQPD